MEPQEHSVDTIMGRRLCSLAVPSAAELPGTFGLPAGNFACLIAWDAQAASVDDVAGLAERLLGAGASYFVCWGPDCQRVHDIIDELAVFAGHEFGVPDDACIVTTWHESEPLEDALWFFLVNSSPDEHYEASTRSALAISVGSQHWATEIASALQDPRGFVDRGREHGVA